jgi:hypothetical protein
VHDVARAATHALDDPQVRTAAEAAAASPDDLLRDVLLRADVWEGAIDQAVEAVRSHPTPDAVRGVVPFMIRADTYHSQIVPMSIAAVDSGHVGRITAAIDQLVARGTTGNGLTTELVDVAGHPRFDDIVELAPLVRRVGTYPHYVIGAARDAVDSGQLERYRAAMQSLVDAGINDGSIAQHVVAALDHAHGDDILRLATGFQRMGAFGFQSIPKATEAVDAGALVRVSQAVDQLVALDIGNSEMVNQLVELARDPRFTQVVELIPSMHRVVPNGYQVVPTAQRVLDSGRSTEIVRLSDELADDGIAYMGMVESLEALLDHPQRDRILEVARTVRDAGSVAHVLDKARLIVESPRSGDVLEMLRIIVDATGPSAYASYVAADLVARNVPLADIRLAVRLGVEHVSSANVAAALRASEVEAAGLGALGDHLALLAPKQLDDQRMTLGAMLRRLSATTPVDEPDKAIIEQLQTLVSDNFQRLAGTKVDGYRFYPDYAEYGRIDSLIRLRELRVRAIEASAAAPSTLTW